MVTETIPKASPKPATSLLGELELAILQLRVEIELAEPHDADALLPKLFRLYRRRLLLREVSQ